MGKVRVCYSLSGNGYRSIHAQDENNRGHILEHRLLMYARGELDSPFFAKDMREIHHVNGDKQLNVEWNLMALTPNEHKDIDPERAKIITPWDRVAGD